MSIEDSIGQKEGLYQIDTQTTRRKFLGVLSASGFSLAGIRKATERAFGKSPDGTPIVWRYDRFGNPETVRFIPKERYRRIMAYHNLDPEYIYEQGEGINGFTLEQQSSSSTDLAYKIFVNDATRSVRRSLPNRINDVPVIVEERKTNPEFARLCDKHIDDFYDPLPANPEIYGKDGDNETNGGTLGVVCYNDDSGDPYECYITAYHVMEHDGSPTEYMMQAGYDDDGNQIIEKVGSYADHSPEGSYEMDVAKYRRRNGTADADIRGNASGKLPDTTGTWTHSGLTDRTSDDELPVEFAGRSTCHAETYCTGTSKTSLLEYQADYSPNEVTNGDSGGPFLDSDGYLVGTFSYFCDECDTSSGPTGKELLDRINAVLYDPSKFN